jgi:hypothetical protein
MADDRLDVVQTSVDDSSYRPYVPVRQRREKALERLSAKRRQPTIEERVKAEGEEERKQKRGPKGPHANETLLQTHGRLVRSNALPEEDEITRQLRQEAEIMRSIRNTKKLMSVEELAKVRPRTRSVSVCVCLSVCYAVCLSVLSISLCACVCVCVRACVCALFTVSACLCA